MKHAELSSNCMASVLRALFICSTAGFFVETVYCNFHSHQLLVFHIVPDHMNICCLLASCLLALCFCEAAPAKLLLYESLQNLKQVKKNVMNLTELVYYSACQVKLELELREKNDKTPERTTKKPKGRTIAPSVAARTSKSSSHITAGDHGCTIRTGYQTGSMAAWQFFSSGHKRYCSKKKQQLKYRYAFSH